MQRRNDNFVMVDGSCTAHCERGTVSNFGVSLCHAKDSFVCVISVGRWRKFVQNLDVLSDSFAKILLVTRNNSPFGLR